MRTPRCHHRLTEPDGAPVVPECDRKDQHKGFHRSAILTDEGQHIEVKWGFYEE